MAKKIILIRHGKLQMLEQYTAFTMVTGTEISGLLNTYDSSEISSRSQPPEKLFEYAKTADLCICSALSRTEASFNKIGVSNCEKSDILNEAQLPSGILNSVKLPCAIWAGLLRILWFSGVSTNCESFRQFMKRMKHAQEYLLSRFDNAGTVMVMSHGFVNIILKQLFLKSGWKRVEQHGHNGYWSYIVMIKK